TFFDTAPPAELPASCGSSTSEVADRPAINDRSRPPGCGGPDGGPDGPPAVPQAVSSGTPPRAVSPSRPAPVASSRRRPSTARPVVELFIAILVGVTRYRGAGVLAPGSTHPRRPSDPGRSWPLNGGSLLGDS